MSHMSDLDLRLKEAGIDPTKPIPCWVCGQPLTIVDVLDNMPICTCSNQECVLGREEELDWIEKPVSTEQDADTSEAERRWLRKYMLDK